MICLENVDNIFTFPDAINAFKQKEIDKAEYFSQEILKNDPKNANVVHLLAIIAVERKDNENALKYFLKAVQLSPNPLFKYNLANYYYQINNFEKAEEYYFKALENNENYPDCHNSLGNLFRSKKEYNKALKHYLKARKIRPTDPNYINNIACIYHLMGNEDEAYKYYVECLNLDPNYVPVYCNIGIIFRNRGQLEEAANYYNKALAVNINDPIAHNNLGNVFLDKYNFDQAIIHYKKVLELDPANFQAYNNIGGAYKEKGELDTAIYYFEKLIQFSPYKDITDPWEIPPGMDIELGEGYLNLSIANFLKRDFEKAWYYYEYRYFINEKKKPRSIQCSKPKWDGFDIKGKRLFIFHEQGFGDVIQFSRYVNYLDSLGARILFNCQKPLVKLFNDSEIKAEIIDDSNPVIVSNIDCYISLLSIPYILKARPENIPYKTKYLKADPEKVDFYKRFFFQHNKFKIGIAHQGNPDNTIDKKRSFPFKYLCKLAKIPNVKLYSLQKDYGLDELNFLPDNIEVINLGKTFEDFSDTAAAIENLDLIITVDTVISHLSAALGKRTWVLLHYIPDWRWLLHSEDSIWYESVRLFRQKNYADWNELSNRVFEEVSKLVISNNHNI